MTADPLAGLRADYEEVARLRGVLADLGTVADARAAYEAARADLAGRVAELARRVRLPPPPPAVPASPVADAGPVKRLSGGNPPPPPPPVTPLPLPPSPDDAARLQLKRDAARWQGDWRLDPDTLGRINRLAGDPARPLGEALALLPWAAFAEYPYKRGLPPEWAAALAAYRDHLADEVRYAELREGTWLGVWRLWKDRDAPAGRPAWEACLAAGRRELEARAAELERALAGGRP